MFCALGGPGPYETRNENQPKGWCGSACQDASRTACRRSCSVASLPNVRQRRDRHCPSQRNRANAAMPQVPLHMVREREAQVVDPDQPVPRLKATRRQRADRRAEPRGGRRSWRFDSRVTQRTVSRYCGPWIGKSPSDAPSRPSRAEVPCLPVHANQNDRTNHLRALLPLLRMRRHLGYRESRDDRSCCAQGNPSLNGRGR
jgi:hypothetical protein